MPHLSPFKSLGDLTFLSGQLGFAAHGSLPEGIEAQTHQCLQNIEATLAQCGSGLADVVKVTVFLTSAGDYPSFDEAYADRFGDHRPARSTVIAGLAIEGALIEIEVIATVRS